MPESGRIAGQFGISRWHINKWQIAITTAPERKDLPKQRIKIEVANIPAHTKTPRPVQKNYDFLPDGYDDTLIYCETLSEIMADKVISLPATQKYIRHRDIWDLAWLIQQGAQLDTALVRKKIADYQISNFGELLAHRIQNLHAIINGRAFDNEIQRFLPAQVCRRTLGQQKFRQYLGEQVTQLLTTTQTNLHKPADNQPTFKM